MREDFPLDMFRLVELNGDLRGQAFSIELVGGTSEGCTYPAYHTPPPSQGNGLGSVAKCYIGIRNYVRHC